MFCRRAFFFCFPKGSYWVIVLLCSVLSETRDDLSTFGTLHMLLYVCTTPTQRQAESLLLFSAIVSQFYAHCTFVQIIGHACTRFVTLARNRLMMLIHHLRFPLTPIWLHLWSMLGCCRVRLT